MSTFSTLFPARRCALIFVQLLALLPAAITLPPVAYAAEPLVVEWSSAESDETYAVAWGDVDNDNDLDLVVANDKQPLRLYRNENGTLDVSAAWFSAEPEDANAVAWGDVDGDGDLDLAVANGTRDSGQPNRIYLNTGGKLDVRPAWSSTERDATRSLAWGDADGDGDLDLVVGNLGQQNRLYLNCTIRNPNCGASDRLLTASFAWQALTPRDTSSVAWGDVDGDGDVDLAVGNGNENNQHEQLYRNCAVRNPDCPADVSLLMTTPVWTSDDPAVANDANDTREIAWLDIESDGDLDLITGNYNQPSRLYRNDGGNLTLSPVWSSNESDNTRGIAVGDYDGDGDLDFATANANEPARIYRNDSGIASGQIRLGGGSDFNRATFSTSESDNARDAAWGDLDGDGDLDLAVATYGEPNRVYASTVSGPGRSPLFSLGENDSTFGIAWGDADGDGDPDLALGNNGQPSRVYLNDRGTLRTSASWSAGQINLTESVAWGDIDNDSDQDLALGNNGVERLYLGCRVPSVGCGPNDTILASQPAWSSSENDYTRSVVWADVDRDGDLDLAVGNGPPGEGQVNRLYLGCTVPNIECQAGDRFLTARAAWTSNERDNTRSLDWGDIDRDGDLDLVAGNVDGPERLYLGCAVRNSECQASDRLLTVRAVWTSLGRPNTANDATDSRGIDLGDVDGDGDLDLAVANSGSENLLYRNCAVRNPDCANSDKFLSTRAVWLAEEREPTFSLAWGDVDRDGDLDLATGNGGFDNDEPERIYLNTGGVLSTRGEQFASEQDETLSIAWADVDGDGDLDLAAGNNRQPTRLYVNQGGRLVGGTIWRSSESGDETRSIRWSDLNGDGLPDLVVGNDSQPLRAYRNLRGRLAPVAFWSSGQAESTQSIDLADVDGNGYPDLAVGNDGQPNRVYRNISGTLELTPSWSAAQSNFTRAVAWGDVDGDGDPDLAIGNGAYQAGRPNQLYLNCRVGRTGDGCQPGDLLAATPIWSSLEADDTRAVAWADMDRDGDLDLAVANFEGQNRLYRNDGGTLTASAVWSSTEAESTTSLAWGDVDGNGYPDLVVGNDRQQLRLYRNNGGTLTASAVWTATEIDRTRSVAWADIDRDGDLDLATGNGDFSGGLPSRIYRNDGGTLTTSAVASLSFSEETFAIAWGDLDNDGDLDLAVGNSREQNRLYRNDGGQLVASEGWVSSENDETTSVAWGDVDADGDLDLAVGNRGQANKLYRNDGGQLSANPVWATVITDTTTSIAWGDSDNDGDLDLATAGDGPERLYRNDGGALTASAVWISAATNPTRSIAWGDVDGDGDLDLAAGGKGSLGVYRNDSGALGAAPAWLASEADDTQSVAWGDIDGDGDLDLASGNFDGPTRIYRNDGGTLTSSAFWSSSETNSAHSIAWGDVNGDGLLDLAVGNSGPSRLYRNIGGTLAPRAAWSSVETNNTFSVTWADADNDGDLDLLAANGGPNSNEQSRLYRNTNGLLDTRADWLTTSGAETTSAAWGDMDNDGDLDLALGNSEQALYILRNGVSGSALLPNRPATIAVARPTLPAASFFSSARTLSSRVISLTYTLSDPDSDSVREIRAFYSLDGGGSWRPAIPVSGTRTTNLAATPSGSSYVFGWDIFASGLFGQSDAVVVRMEAYSSVLPTLRGVPNAFQRPYAAATTPPFSVRGTQVRVLSSSGQPLSGAEVYRLPAGQVRGASPFSSGEQALQTNNQGFLQGRGALALGDQIMALQAISATETYTIYQTSAGPTTTGLALQPVVEPGVQTLVVSPTNTLLLFNLDVSLEWDARNDQIFLAQLRFDLQRTSELLFDWTNGQVALGDIRVFHNREQWDEAHIRLYATNRLRPNANQGGIVTEVRTDPISPTIVYAPGQVRMGASWNRYGEATGSLGEDWPRTLAHELGHYLLFLDDNYIGLLDGLLVPIEGCPGPMSDPYGAAVGTFHPQPGWLPRCENTLSQQETGRSDWQTITNFYPQLRAPATSYESTLPGPSGLPLAVTRIQESRPVTPSDALIDPVFALVQGGAAVQPGSGARAFLFRREGDALLDLGSPIRDQVTARGARVGDRLCVYELNAATPRLGCRSITPTDEQLALSDTPGWRPELLITPVTSRTILLQVTSSSVPTGTALRARIYPADGVASTEVDLVAGVGGYSGQITLEEPALDGFVHLYEASAPSDTRREAIADYTLGGNPGRVRARRTPDGGVDQGRVRARRAPGAWQGRVRARRAPAVSSDGQVILFGNDLTFAEEQFFTVQAATALPPLPPGRTAVGKGYWIQASANAPDLRQTSISMGYPGREVPPGQEQWLTVYHWDGDSWTALPTRLDAGRNEASARVAGSGLYALLTAFTTPLRAGWNNIAYPVAGPPQPVGAALASISGDYSIVYGYRTSEPSDPWRVYAPLPAPAWASDLDTLTFGEGYWIYALRDNNLYLSGAGDTAVASNASLDTPPALVYGTVYPLGDYIPAADQAVIARMGEVICGRGVTESIGNQIVYRLKVASANAANPQCGALGRPLVIGIDGTSFQVTLTWDNTKAREASLNRRQLFPVLVVGRGR